MIATPLKTRFAQRGLLVLIMAGMFQLCCIPVYADTGIPDNPIYDNSDLLIASVLDRFQYPYPTGAVENPNTHRLDFRNSPGLPTTAWKDEIRYEAAYKFCAHLMPSLPKPPVGSAGATLTLDDVRTISAARGDRALLAVASEVCFAAVDYRTAFPPKAMISSDGIDAHTAQAKMCHYLKDPSVNPAAPPTILPQTGYGLGITNIGDNEIANALKDCDTIGLSTAMYDKIMAYKCNDANYAQHLGAVLKDPPTVEHVSQFECQKTKADFEAKLDRERQMLVTAIQTLLQMREVGTPVNALARPAQ